MLRKKTSAPPPPDLSQRLEKLLTDPEPRARPSHILKAIESAAVGLSDRAQENLSDLIEWMHEAETLAQSGKLSKVTKKIETRAEKPLPVVQDLLEEIAPKPKSAKAAPKKAGVEIVGPPKPGEYPVVKVFVDGGARGNPGPAGIGIVMRDDGDETIWTHGEAIGSETNNVAEYTALIRALTMAKQLKVLHIEVLSDSELIVNQMLGRYQVKNAGLLPLYEQARGLARGFERFKIRHIPRAMNKTADLLVNQALDAAR